MICPRCGFDEPTDITTLTDKEDRFICPKCFEDFKNGGSESNKSKKARYQKRDNKGNRGWIGRFIDSCTKSSKT
jgi:transposase-like protein